MTHRAPLTRSLITALAIAACGDGGTAPTDTGAAPRLLYDGSWVQAGFPFGHDGMPYESDNFIVYSGYSAQEERRYVALELEECFVELKASLDVTNHDEFDYPSQQDRIDVLTLKQQGINVFWTGAAYRYGLVVHAPDSPRYVREGYTRSLYRQLLKHELTHVTEYLLVGTQGDQTWVEKWFHEGIATYLAGIPPNQVTQVAEVQTWLDEMSGLSGGGNPIAVKTVDHYPPEVRTDVAVLSKYYMFFELAVRYVFDPHGHGASVEDVKAMYLDIRSLRGSHGAERQPIRAGFLRTHRGVSRAELTHGNSTPVTPSAARPAVAPRNKSCWQRAVEAIGGSTGAASGSQGERRAVPLRQNAHHRQTPQCAPHQGPPPPPAQRAPIPTMT